MHEFASHLSQFVRVLMLTLPLRCTLASANGDLDLSFGQAGQVTVRRSGAMPQASAQVGDLAWLNDGSSLWVMENNLGGAVVGRLLSHGGLDASFGNGGQTLLSCARSGPTRMQAMADGALVVWTGRCLRRLDASGTEDANFAQAAILPPTQFRAAALRQDSQRRLVLAGRNGNLWEAYRYMSDGSNDLSFGINGVARLSVASSSELKAMQLLNDGAIILAGGNAPLFQTNLLVHKLTTAGVLDSDFGAQGRLELAPPAGYNGWSATAITLHANQTLLLAGRANGQFGETHILVVQLRSIGAKPLMAQNVLSLGDTVSLTPFGESAEAIAILPNGKVLIGLTSFPPSTQATRTRFTLMRLTGDLQFDRSFDEDGWRSYVVNDPESAGQTGPYSQLHNMVLKGTQVTLFGRTFFEDGAVNSDSYSTFLRVNFDVIWKDGFEARNGS